MVRLIFSGLLLIAAAQSAEAAKDCTCRYQGTDILEGQTACIKSPTGMQMARCEKVLNNTSWKFLNVPCPLALKENVPDLSIGTPSPLEIRTRTIYQL